MEKEWVQVQRKTRGNTAQLSQRKQDQTMHPPKRGKDASAAAAAAAVGSAPRSADTEPKRKRNVRRPARKDDGVYVPALYGVKPREITLSDVIVASKAPRDSRYNSGPKRRIQTSTTDPQSKQFIGVVKPKRKKRLTALKRKLLEQRKLFHQASGHPATAESSTSSIVEVHNFVQLGELYEEDEYDELVADLNALGAEFGQVATVTIPHVPMDDGDSARRITGQASITYQSSAEATLAQLGMAGVVLGGATLVARIVGSGQHLDNLEPKSQTFDLFVDGCVRKSEIEDEEEKAEVLKDLRELCAEDAQPLAIDIQTYQVENTRAHRSLSFQLPLYPGTGPPPTNDGVCIYTFQNPEEAQAAATSFNSMIVGGEKIWSVAGMGTFALRLRNYISAEDVQDDDEKQEIVDGLKILLNDPTAQINIHSTADETFVELITPTSPKAEQYRHLLEGMTVAGETVTTEGPTLVNGAPDTAAFVWGLVSREDLEADEEDFEEIISDLKQLVQPNSAQAQLEIFSMHNDQLVTLQSCRDDPFVTLRFAFSTEAARDSARARLDGKVIGGSSATASIRSNASPEVESEIKSVDGPDDSKSVPGSATTISHLPKHERPALAIPVASEELQPIVRELLKTLMEYQTRAKDRNVRKSTTKKRLVIGMREIMRDIRARAIKLLVLAPDTEKTDVVDEKVEQLVQTAVASKVPMLYALSRRQLGKALGTNMRYSAVGVAFVDGAYNHFKTIANFVNAFGEISLELPADAEDVERGSDEGV